MDEKQDVFRSSGTLCELFTNNGDNTFTELPGTSFATFSQTFDAAWEDYDNNGYSDLLLSGNGSGYELHLYKNTDGNTFVEQTSISFPNIQDCKVEWVDYNQDGYADIFLTGDFETKLLKNINGSNFEEQTSLSLNNINKPISVWGDFNNDNYPDLAVTAWYYSKLFINNTDGTFEELSGIDFFNWDDNALMTVADYDKDEKIDILVSGKDGNSNMVTKLFKNNGDTTFTEQTEIQITGTNGEYITCCDLNNDTHPDLLLCGINNSSEPISEVYINNQTGLLKKIPANQTIKNHFGFAAWADHNKDNLPDVALCGTDIDTDKFSQLCNSFENTVNSIVDLAYGNISWTDFNNDGFADLLICGEEINGLPGSYLYKNGTNGIFPLTNSNLIGLKNGYSDWADYNHDGLTDLLITGTNSNGALVTKIYKNIGNNNFEETNIYIEGASKGIWGDHDKDKDFDILIINLDKNIVLYENSDNSFTKILTFADHKADDVLWTDVNNDGYIDIFQSAYSNTHQMRLSRNTGSGNYVWGQIYDINNDTTIKNLSFADTDNNGKKEIIMNGQSLNGNDAAYFFEYNNSALEVKEFFPGTLNGNLSWADWDNDNDLDLYITGMKQDGNLSADLYINNSDVPNTAPDPPSNLSFECQNDSVFISWNAPTDNDETPQAGLSYNCYMYEVGGDTVWHSLSNHTTGKRYIPKEGNVGHNTSWLIQGLDRNKKYAWSVQSVDNGFMGSAFAPEDTFRLAPAFLIQPIDQTVCETGSITFNAATTPDASYQWCCITANDTTAVGNNEFYNNATTANLTISNAQLAMNDSIFILRASTNNNTTHSFSNPLSLTVDTFMLADAGDDAGVCVETQTQLSAADPFPYEGTWSCEIEQVSFSNIHAPEAVVYNLPEGSNTNLIWTVTQNNVCGSNSDIVVIEQNPDGVLPSKASKPEGETKLCIGNTSIITTAGANDAETYNWEIFPPEAGIISQNGISIIANWSNDYSGFADIRVQAENECGKGEWSDNLIVELKDINANDIIQKSEYMLVSVDSGYMYQWYYNDALIPGADKQYYYNENPQAGNYRVKISFYEGCEKLSSIFELNAVNKSLSLSETINIYPNPASNQITIEIDNDILGRIRYKITDNLGRIRTENTINKTQKILNHTESLNVIPSGVYLIDFLFDNNEKVSKQLIIK